MVAATPEGTFGLSCQKREWPIRLSCPKKNRGQHCPAAVDVKELVLLFK